MSKFSGTGGNWSYSKSLGEVKSDTGGLVAELIVNGLEDENGRLIAAAPKLHAALSRLEEWATIMHGNGVNYSGDHPIAVARAVILSSTN